MMVMAFQSSPIRNRPEFFIGSHFTNSPERPQHFQGEDELVLKGPLKPRVQGFTLQRS
jgi:hypothetical protein